MSNAGKLKCLECGKFYHHLGSHLWHGHGMLAREYKEAHELPFKMALISDQVYEKKSQAFEAHREYYLKALLKHGKEHQFPKGNNGVRRVSEHERKVVLARILDVNKRKRVLAPCPVCHMKFNHVESHLFNKHKLISVKNLK